MTPDVNTLKTLLSSARTIAIVGAKDVPGQPVDTVGRYLLEKGYHLIPVHPKRNTVWGIPAVTDLASIQEPVDIVVLFRAPRFCEEHAQEVMAWKTLPQCFWMQEGISSPEACRIFEGTSVRVIENRCIMVEHKRLLGECAMTSASEKEDSVRIEAPVDDTEVFTCKMCGQCCRGQGGIVVGPRDLVRITKALGISEQTFRDRYGEIRGGKLQIRTGDDGACIFFKDGEGCTVHAGKPDVCRAWPFFRGNIIDPDSHAMAMDYCPGIKREASHEDFAKAGRAYLRKYGLLCEDAETEGRAVILD